jgi:hypothetical protein
MFSDQISDYFEGVAAKYLSAVDADPGRSHQHEIGGLPAAGFKQHLGTPGKDQEYRFKAKQIYFADEDLAPEVVDGDVTWYDCRRKQVHRGPEYRLYYSNNAFTELLCEGDFLLIAKMKDGSLLMVATPAESTIESQLRALFGLSHIDDRFKAGSVNAMQLLLPLRLMLESLGIETGKVETGDDIWLERLIMLFGRAGFPSTSSFSKYARESIEDQPDPLGNPDQALMNWMEHEEKLFRIYERFLVQHRLRQGFGEYGDNVDEFIGFSLSVQNRRKSRVGHAFESHLAEIFSVHGLAFEQGRGKGFTTEGNSKPDFIFPSFRSYRDEGFPSEGIILLGAKTTCKDRWRQVLNEGHRVLKKHLVTMEVAISETQTLEMDAANLQLVVPGRIHATYSQRQRDWLIDISQFVELVKFKFSAIKC